MTRPLDGVTVVSLEQAVAAPFATRQLADLGARVIKIERPDGGDFARGYDDAVHGNSSYFVWLNRAKQSLTLDVKSAEGRAVLGELLGSADVLVQNLGPGAAARLGVDAATLATAHPHVIACTISGYGTTGPWRARKAYDALIQCEAGLVSLTGSEAEMAKAGISVADIAAGMYAYSGVLTALLRRATSGVVAPVEVSLFDALAEWMGSPAYYTRYGGTTPRRVGAQHATIAPYGPYATVDGTVMISVQSEREWRALCAGVLGESAIASDPRFTSSSQRVAHREELNEVVGTAFAALDLTTAIARLDAAGIANARITEMADFAEHPVLRGRERWCTVGVPGGGPRVEVEALLPPVELGGVEPVMGDVPALGEHTDAILRELGRTEQTIIDLRRRALI
jgi:itaconate CoA-transferase